MKISILETMCQNENSVPWFDLEYLRTKAPELDDMGFHRLFFTEDHGPHTLNMAPELLIAAIGAVTENIRLGVCGMQIASNPAIKLVERFRLLNAMFGDRIDLGLSTGPTGHYDAYLEALGLGGYRDPRNIFAGAKEILKFQKNEFDEKNNFYDLTLLSGVTDPDLWWVTSNRERAIRSANHKIGLIYNFRDCNWQKAKEVLAAYKEIRPEPNAMACVSIFIAASREEAMTLTKPDISTPFYVKNGMTTPIFGTANEVYDALCQYGVDTGFEEFLIMCPIFDIQRRFDVYRALGELLD
jgi:alkanesulfonate monooxygenase SsuD/methylene tetrahydromethanopterin reductase-like flavin-dependent oxidoreductase (luciferase family)